MRRAWLSPSSIFPRRRELVSFRRNIPAAEGKRKETVSLKAKNLYISPVGLLAHRWESAYPKRTSHSKTSVVPSSCLASRPCVITHSRRRDLSTGTQGTKDWRSQSLPLAGKSFRF